MTPTTALVARPDLHFAPVPNGVYVSGPRGRFVLSGSELLHAVAEGCVPLLESGASEDELVAAIGTEKSRPAVRHLIGKMRECGMLLDPAAFTVAAPAPEVRERFPEALARLESALDDPYAAFARLRSARVLLAGPAEATGPAARGLRRAGAGEVTEAVSLAAYEAAHPGAAYDGVDAVVEMTTGDTQHPAAVPDGVPLLTVLLGGRVALVGPVLTGPGRHGVWAAFRDRASAWAEAEACDPAPRPVADALAGALAGQSLFDSLAGTAEPGTGHVVYGADLATDPVAVEGALHPAAATGRPSTLDDVPALPMPDAEEALEAAASVARRWTGLFASAAGEDLPQMPLALRVAEYRAGRSGAVVGWAAHQETATVAAALAALRARASRPGVPAAGLTEEHWLLDGVLRVLAGDPALEQDPEAPLDPEGARILAGLRAAGRDPEVAVLRLPELDWRIARVSLGGVPLGRGWGATAEEAVRTALCTALARVQAGGSGTVAELSTDALLFADGAVIGRLREQLTARAARAGTGYRGLAERTDPVLGPLPLWFGAVEAVTVAPPQEARDAG
ncbi:hypothetical protein ABZ934_07220 [Streptomyces sp. NPDC046557]|uniref:hypothetical protein n=1 Tax=Streptomyces sp. NPDC046557 TaxID=3155372 RepID=UPI0033E74AD9